MCGGVEDATRRSPTNFVKQKILKEKKSHLHLCQVGGTIRLEAIASRLEAIAIRLEAIKKNVIEGQIKD